MKSKLGLLGLAGLFAAVIATAACTRLERYANRFADRFLTPDTWVNVDLWVNPPETEGKGDGEVLGVADTLHQRGLRALSLAPERPLRWRLALGERPSLRLRPIADGDCALRLAVVAGGAAAPLHRSWLKAPEPAFIPPPYLSLDLERWAGQEVAIEAHAEARSPGACRQVLLGSPSLIEKRPRRRTRMLAQDRLNVILLSADTLRADAIGFWGRSPSPTPAIDRLAARGDTFTNAHTTINNTNPSFVSMMTGLYAKDHQVYDLVSALPPSHETLVEKFDRAGYVTRAVLAATHLGSTSGLDQGVHGLTQPTGQFYGETVSNLALHYLQEPAEMPEPFFLWLHYFDTHVPHNPPAPWARGLVPEGLWGLEPAQLWRPFREVGLLSFDHQPPRYLDGNRQLYESEVAYLDRQVERVLRALEEQGLAERTLLVFVADHGETLGERGNYFDHVGLHANTTHVPLVVLHPGQKKGRVFDGLVQNFDLYPTVLRLAGLDVPTQVDARDLYSLGQKGRPAVFAEHANNTGAMVRTARHLYYRNHSEELFPVGDYLYDLAADPGEQHNLAGTGVPEEARLADALGRFLADKRPLPPAIRVDVAPEEIERLRALGYVE